MKYVDVLRFRVFALLFMLAIAGCSAVSSPNGVTNGEYTGFLEGVKVERVGEGIKLTFSSGILFDVNKSDLRPASEMNLEKLSTILSKYPDTNILIGSGDVIVNNVTP